MILDMYNRLVELQMKLDDPRACDENAEELRHILVDFKKVCDTLWPTVPSDAKLIGVDFDGVISNYENGRLGWAPYPADTPTPNAIEWLTNIAMDERYKVVIFSHRCNSISGTQGIQQWLWGKGMDERAIERLTFQPGKPPFHLLIDDRAKRYEGEYHGLGEQLADIVPWYYKHFRQ